jgi:hypothetical protein
MKSLRVPVAIDRDVYDMFKAVSQATGIPVARLIRDAMTSFKPELERRLEILKQGSSDRRSQ